MLKVAQTVACVADREGRLSGKSRIVRDIK